MTSPILSSRNRALRTALDSLPGYAAGQAAAQHARQARTDRLAAMNDQGDVEAAVYADLVAALRAGDPPPEDLQPRLLAATQTMALNLAETTMLQRAVEDLEDAQQAPLDRDLTPAFAALDRMLPGILKPIPALAAALGPVQDPATAIEAGLTDEWRAQQLALASYVELRDAQRQLARHTVRSTQGSYRLDEFDLVANVADVFPTVAEWRKDQARRAPGHYQPGISPPWARDVDDWTFLVWLATSPARAWVPTPEAAEAQRHTVLAPALAVEQLQRNSARAEARSDRASTPLGRAALRIAASR